MAERGRFNSSITRVRPVFSALLDRDPAGRTWLGPLLRATPNPRFVAAGLTEAPGEIRPHLLERRPYRDKVLGPIQLLRCFEYPVPPPRRFIEWLLSNPGELHWPTDRQGRRKRFGATTQKLRERLVDGGSASRAQTRELGTAELAKYGAARSRRCWWAFEGFTEVDCVLETDRLVMFIEGKRTEALSPSTEWFPARNQLVRNLEALADFAGERTAGVLLVTEEPGPELSPDQVAASTPHLDETERANLLKRYLGQTTWRTLCTALGLSYEALPATSGEAPAAGASASGHETVEVREP
jgi:hypothetical protein